MLKNEKRFETRDERNYFYGCFLSSFLAGQFFALLLVFLWSGCVGTPDVSFGRRLILFLSSAVLGLLFGFVFTALSGSACYLFGIGSEGSHSLLRIVGIVLLVSAAICFYPILFPEQADDDEPYHVVLQVVNSSEQYENLIFASVESDKYHDPSCQYVKNINLGNLICFDSSEAAENCGFTPCPICFPRDEEHDVDFSDSTSSSPPATSSNSKPSLSEIYRTARNE
ncbi:hypothetical protein [Anaerotruncus massiliensis (ex Liu et al. 2021)]|uniref:hypothetical protein n=1 Tax=Anaerotruncus massiliensis (ex Liu et al. 2021) TaxID=2321404 RepID=UPI003AF4BF51